MITDIVLRTRHNVTFTIKPPDSSPGPSYSPSTRLIIQDHKMFRSPHTGEYEEPAPIVAALTSQERDELVRALRS